MTPKDIIDDPAGAIWLVFRDYGRTAAVECADEAEAIAIDRAIRSVCQEACWWHQKYSHHAAVVGLAGDYGIWSIDLTWPSA